MRWETPFWSTVVAFLFLLAGAVAVVSVVLKLGREDRRDHLFRVHHAAGWVFASIYYAMLVHMLVRVSESREEFPPRIVAHITLAIALCFLIALKIGIARYIPAFARNLFPLGVMIYALAFPMALITAGNYLLALYNRDAYVFHDVLRPALADERLGKEFLIANCSTCHPLERILRPRSRAAWESVVGRMTLLAPRIPAEEAKQILYYLASNFAPKAVPRKEGMTLLEKHCLPCHSADEIHTHQYSFEGWRAVIAKMSAMDETIVPEDKIEELAAHLAAGATGR